MASAAVSDRGGSGVPLVYADDPPTTTKPKTTSTNGASKNGASNDNRNDNDQQRVLRPVNLAVGEIEYSDPLIVNEKADICVNFTVFGNRDERFTISLYIEGHDLQEEQVRFREGEHHECFEVRLQQAGTQLVVFRLDPENNIAESNEDDNRASQGLKWAEQPRPDLVLGYLGSRKVTESCNEPIHVGAGVTNLGTAQARKFDVELFVNGERKKQERVQDVAPGETAELIFDGFKLKTAGSYELVVKIDTDDEVDESDEQNNKEAWLYTNDCQDIPYEDGDDDDDDD
jgi:subtilase family serine protease